MKLLAFMESRWGFQFESVLQKEELLHLSFVNDGREVPPEITEDNISALNIAEDTEDGDETEHLTSLIMNWAGIKDEVGEIHLDPEHCGKRYVRFTTDAVDGILPDAPEPDSGWGTRNHYFYEIVNSKNGKIYIQLALSAENIPDDLRAICETITEHFPSRIMKENWKWRTPFSTDRIDITGFSDEEIIAVLNDLYAATMKFQSELVDTMRLISTP